jgi:hypothetical protein
MPPAGSGPRPKVNNQQRYAESYGYNQSNSDYYKHTSVTNPQPKEHRPDDAMELTWSCYKACRQFEIIVKMP